MKRKFEKITSGFIGKNAVFVEKPKTKRQYPDFEDLRNRNYEEIKDPKFPSNCKLFIEVPKVTERVGRPVAIGQMLPRIKARILAKIAGKS